MTYICHCQQQLAKGSVQLGYRFEANTDDEARKQAKDTIEYFDVGRGVFLLENTTLERVEAMFPRERTIRIPVVSIPV